MAKCGFDVCTATFKMSLENYLGKEWKEFGAVPTPKDVVDFMIDVAGIKKWEGLNILEPGCGFCSFTREIYCSHPNNTFWGVEINQKVYDVISKLFPCFNIVFGDFLLWQTDERFDLVIGNPPYGIPGSKRYPIKIPEEVREKYRKLFETAKGKYNMYGYFVEKGVKLLKEGGRLVYIVPSTFMILDEFSKLREFLSMTGELDIYYLGWGVFEKNVSVSVIVVTKDPSLRGVLKLYEVRNYLTRDMKLWYVKTDFKGEIIRFENEETKKFEEGKPKLGDLFEIYFGPTTVIYRNHPKFSPVPKPCYVCVLKGDNIIKPNVIDYKSCHSGIWIPKDAIGEFKKYFTVPHIVVRDTADGNVVAAFDDRCYPWLEQNHLIPKVSLTMDELKEVTKYLNSKEVQWYVRTLYKDITPHTTITQLKLLPLPKEYWKYLKGSVAGQ